MIRTLRHLFPTLLVLFACTEPLKLPNTEEVSAVIGAAGGSLKHPTGALLNIPAGALSAEVLLSIKGQAAPSLAELGAAAAGQAFLLGPEGQQFQAPITISVPYDPAQLPAGLVASALKIRLSPQTANDFVELDTVADEAAKLLTAQVTHFSVAVPAAPTGLSFVPAPLAGGQQGAPYSSSVSATGGTPPYAFSVAAGALPAGLSLEQNGVITGTPTTAGSFPFTLRITDSASPPARVEKSFTVAIAAPSVCTRLELTAPLVVTSAVASAAPAPLGGSLFAGTFERVSETLYTGAGGQSGSTGEQGRRTIRIAVSGEALSLEVASQEGSSPVEYGAGTVTVSGASITFNRTCPSPSASTLSFTMSGTRLTVFEPDGASTRASTYLLQASDGGTATDAGSGPCHALQNIGPVVYETRVAATAPAPAGGVVSGGTYVRVSDLVYTGAGGASGPTSNGQQQTLRFVTNTETSATVEDHTRRLGDTASQVRTYSATTSGTSLTTTLTCPATGSQTIGFSFASDEFSVFEPVTLGTRVTLWQRLYPDGGVPPARAAPDAGAPVDAGLPDAGPSLATVGTGLSDLVDLDVAGTDVFTLGNGEVRRCAQSGCGTGASLVATTFASSLAVDGTTLFVTSGYRYVESCSLSGTCTFTPFTDLGASSYPAHLWVANGRLYWLSESGSTRRIQTCPLAGCTTGYPKIVYAGALLDGVPVSGLSVNATHAYVISYTGGVFAIPLTDADTGNAAAAAQLSPSGYGSGGLELDGTSLRWTNVLSGTIEGCAAASCVAGQVKSGVTAPSGVRATATHVYGITRGTPNGSGGYVTGTGSIWRYAK